MIVMVPPHKFQILTGFPTSVSLPRRAFLFHLVHFFLFFVRRHTEVEFFFRFMNLVMVSWWRESAALEQLMTDLT